MSANKESSIQESLKIYNPQEALEDVIKLIWGTQSTVQESQALSGGCIGDVHKLQLSTGEQIVHKRYSNDVRKDTSPEYRTMNEAIGLVRIAETSSISVPILYAVHGTNLLLSYHPPEDPQDGFWQDFAHKLAILHQAPIEYLTETSMEEAQRRSAYGFAPSIYDEYANNHQYYQSEPLGRTHKYYDSWVAFYAQERIWKQCMRAEKNGYFDTNIMKNAAKLCEHMPALIDEPAFPSILHGDLWAGNYLCAKNTPILIDPAVNIGHFEAEMSLTQLFGGYPKEFYCAYSEILTLDKGFFKERIDLYNLYHILNHLNLFGRSYYYDSVRIIEAFC